MEGIVTSGKKYARPIVLGVNAAYHESAAALVCGGNIEFAIEEERLSRVKHAKTAQVCNPDQLPWGAIQSCLESAGLSSLEQVDAVGYSLVPGDRLSMIDVDPYSIGPGVKFGTSEGELEFDRRVRSVPDLISNAAHGGATVPSFHFVPHHLAHASFAFSSSPFDHAAILVVDGIGEKSTTWLGHAVGQALTPLEQIPYPHSIGMLWERIAVYLGFSEYDACKIMALAALGDPEMFRPGMDKLFCVPNPIGGVCCDRSMPIQIDAASARFRAGDVAGLEKLFGPGRKLYESAESERFVNLTATLQERTEEAVLALASRLAKSTGESRLVYGGGVALNCIANSRLERDGPFDEIYIAGAAHDAGTAVGAALEVTKSLGISLPNASMRGVSTPFLGPAFDAKSIDDALLSHGLAAEYIPDPAALAASFVAKGAIVGWFQGRLEFGPRALGGRSLLADPRRSSMRSELNERVKHREAFRPFAASVLAEAVGEWFEIPNHRVGAVASRDLMLLAYTIKPSHAEEVPAILHSDLTSRIQAVSQDRTPLFYRLINEFRRLTGVPMVLNTSFNDREPIVATPRDALLMFLQSRIDVLFLGDRLVIRAS